MALDPSSIFALQKMLSDAAGEQDSDSGMEYGSNRSETQSQRLSALGPGDVGPKKVESQKSTSAYIKKPQSKDIWDEEEVKMAPEYDDVYDPRPQPDYDISYRQAITTEDMYLGMGNKTPATASCESMVVKIKLPGTTMADVTLDCKDTFLDCRTTKYKLGLHLPHPTDSKNGKAQWDGKTETLTVTLTMKRDFDFMNL